MPGLVLGSMIPDLEVPLLALMTGFLKDRLILHSILGSMMLAPILSELVRPAFSHVARLICGCSREVRGGPAFLASAGIAAFSHTIIDGMHHPYNPLLWPIYWGSIDYIVPFGDYVLASKVLHALFLLAAVLLLLKFVVRARKDGFDRACVEALFGG